MTNCPKPRFRAKIPESAQNADLPNAGRYRSGIAWAMPDYLDADGRLWFCGREAERVETAEGPMFTEPCEQVFRSASRGWRAAR